MIREAGLVATKRALVTNSPSGLFQRFSRTILRSQERLGSCRGSGLLGLSEQKQKGRGISSIERNQRYRAASENAVQVLRKARGIHRIRSARFSTGKDLEAETMAFPPYDENNIFKKIINGDMPCYKIFETEHSLAFLDAFPITPGHSLLVPKATGYATIMDMPPSAAADFLKDLPILAKAVQEATDCTVSAILNQSIMTFSGDLKQCKFELGVNIVQNNGAVAGQVVFHVHFHVIPRTEGDGAVKLGHRAGGGMITKEEAMPILDSIKAKL